MARGIAYLDGPRLQRCLIAGLERLVDRREYLNSINVFPVPDGDTGNNLAHAAIAGLEALQIAVDSQADTVLARLADAVLDAAQGNSGALLAQFLQALADSAAAQSRLSTAQFSDALNFAAVATRTAIENPCEGTIISAIDASARAAQANAACDDFTHLLLAMRDAAQQALAATTEQLDSLRRAGVVDAGAAGYCAILEGCYDYLQYGSITAHTRLQVSGEIASLHPAHITDDFRYRFCTECMIVGAALEPTRLRARLGGQGDSIIVAGSSSRLRIHIHTDHPEQVFRQAAEFGRVLNTKADDMRSMVNSLASDIKTVAIVTDSAADLPADTIAALNIHVVPLRITFGEQSFLDKIGMGAQSFQAEMLRNPLRPGTSQPTQGDLRRTYEFLLTHFAEVLFISVSSQLSGTYQAATNAARSLKGAERIRVVDSANVSVGQGMITKRAAELVAAGMAGTSLVSELDREIAAIRTFALVKDLGNAVRSGRVGRPVKRIADWLHVTPVLVNTRTGKIGVHGVIPGRFRLPQRFAHYIARNMHGAGRGEIGIAAGIADSADAELLRNELAGNLQNTDTIWQTDIGTALSIHTGNSALVVALREIH